MTYWVFSELVLIRKRRVFSDSFHRSDFGPRSSCRCFSSPQVLHFSYFVFSVTSTKWDRSLKIQYTMDGVEKAFNVCNTEADAPDQIYPVRGQSSKMVTAIMIIRIQNLWSWERDSIQKEDEGHPCSWLWMGVETAWCAHEGRQSWSRLSHITIWNRQELLSSWLYKLEDSGFGRISIQKLRKTVVI